MAEYLSVDHPRFRRVQRDVFFRRVVEDCMNHSCRMVSSDSERLDACCQYGVDVDLGERDAVLAHAEQITEILDEDVRGRPWFTKDEKADDDFPSGKFVRTNTADRGCIFLSHDGRGCAIHRAAVEADWDFRGVKPHVCRLFPMTYEDDALVLSDDYEDYSCADYKDSRSVYRVTRELLIELFGDDLVRKLDDLEQKVLASQLRVIDGGKQAEAAVAPK